MDREDWPVPQPPDAEVALWAEQKVIAVQSPLTERRDIIRLLRLLADRMEDGLDAGVHWN